MKTRFMIENPSAIEATVEITMPIREWIDFRDQLSKDYPSWRLSVAITDLIAQAEKVFFTQEG